MSFWTLLSLLLIVTWAGLAGAWQLAHSWRWIQLSADAARRHGPPPRVLWALTVALGAAGALVFLVLARAWQATPALGLDRWAAELARAAWSPGAQAWMLPLTHLGDPITLWALAGVVALGLWWRHERWLAFAWLATLAGNALWNPGLKLVFERLRPVPDVSGLLAKGYSFPSGHSSGAMVVYGMLAYLAFRLLPLRWHLPALLMAATLILAIGASRVFLQAHFATDVMAGFALGGVWLALCIALCSTRLARGP